MAGRQFLFSEARHDIATTSIMGICPQRNLPVDDADSDPTAFFIRGRRQVLAIELTLTILALVSIFFHVYTAFAKGSRPSQWNHFFLVVAGVITSGSSMVPICLTKSSQILTLTHSCLTLSSFNSDTRSLLKVIGVEVSSRCAVR